MMTMNKFAILLVLFFVLPNIVSSECTCDKSSSGEGTTDHHQKVEVLKYKIIALAAILVAGGVGVSLPTIGKIIPVFSPEKDMFHIIKAFAAGVILSTGMVHILPDAFDSLASPCLPENPWKEFPFAGFVAMVSSMGTLMVDSFATSYLNKKQQSHFNEDKVGGNNNDTDVEIAHDHTASHVLPTEDSAADTLILLRHRVISQVLELGIIVHSVIIGISLGTSQSPSTIKPLIAALSFHQLFEGMGLGGCISQAKFKIRSSILMSIFFSLTTPGGIVVGYLISNIYEEDSPKALIVQGIFNSAAAGILVYMALVDLLAADFMSTKLQNNIRLQLSAYLFLLLGAGCMSLLAIWA